jgi:hypothetical protein
VEFALSILSAFFGVVSVCQAIARKDQQRALRAYGQGMYNQLWRMGASAEALLACNDLSEAKRIATGINEVSQAVRNAVIAFSREHARFVPYSEPQWEPRQLPQPFWRRIFLR